ncbi:MAG: rhodanese-like domain-containing protein [Lewinella sp.]|jgi:rhodanese-related sulfurtransferase|uniref:rhodanese-like domain-containing protein n=1 Tax=Lewinella sp. TaxID=2004506 RepID=UPI003D6C173C
MITSWKNLSLLSYLLLALMTASCQSSSNTDSNNEGFQDLNVAEFKQKMETRGVVVLDVRTPEETAEGMITGAQELDFRAPDFQEQLGKLDPDKTYLVYCRSGGRSSSACSMMEGMGFKSVYNLVGGYQGWSAEN